MPSYSAHVSSFGCLTNLGVYSRCVDQNGSLGPTRPRLTPWDLLNCFPSGLEATQAWPSLSPVLGDSNEDLASLVISQAPKPSLKVGLLRPIKPFVNGSECTTNVHKRCSLPSPQLIRRNQSGVIKLSWCLIQGVILTLCLILNTFILPY